MIKIIEALHIVNIVLYPLWPIGFVFFFLLAIRDIVKGKDAGFWSQKAIAATICLMIMMTGVGDAL
jgi:hypothetical protein